MVLREYNGGGFPGRGEGVSSAARRRRPRPPTRVPAAAVASEAPPAEDGTAAAGGGEQPGASFIGDTGESRRQGRRLFTPQLTRALARLVLYTSLSTSEKPRIQLG